MAMLAALAQALWRRRRCAGSPITYVEIFRGTSALVQLFWLFFVLPLFGIIDRAFTVAVLGARSQCRRLWCGSACAAPSSRVARGQWEATTALNMTRGPDAAPHHPAAGLRRHDPALGQSLHRAAEVDRAGLAHHLDRSRLQGAADEPDDDEDDPDLHPRRCSSISRCRSVITIGMRCARAARLARPGAREDRA